MSHQNVIIFLSVSTFLTNFCLLYHIFPRMYVKTKTYNTTSVCSECLLLYFSYFIPLDCELKNMEKSYGTRMKVQVVYLKHLWVDVINSVDFIWCMKMHRTNFFPTSFQFFITSEYEMGVCPYRIFSWLVNTIRFLCWYSSKNPSNHQENVLRQRIPKSAGKGLYALRATSFASTRSLTLQFSTVSDFVLQTYFLILSFLHPTFIEIVLQNLFVSLTSDLAKHKDWAESELQHCKF